MNTVLDSLILYIALRREPWTSLWKKNVRFRRNIPDDELAQAVTPPRDLPPLEDLQLQLTADGPTAMQVSPMLNFIGMLWSIHSMEIMMIIFSFSFQL